jgi:hypothetical protein
MRRFRAVVHELALFAHEIDAQLKRLNCGGDYRIVHTFQFAPRANQGIQSGPRTTIPGTLQVLLKYGYTGSLRLSQTVAALGPAVLFHRCFAAD